MPERISLRPGWRLVAALSALFAMAAGLAAAGAPGWRMASEPIDIEVAVLMLDFPDLDKQLPLRVAFPASGGSFPLIVFSHGNNCSRDLYSGFVDHWAANGYVVIQPTHMDSRDLGFTMKGVTPQKMDEVIDTRRADLRFILDSVAEIEATVPGLAGKIDTGRLIAAGHSLGAGTAMSLNGVQMIDPRNGRLIASDEDRFEVLVLISEPGNMRLMPDEPWRMSRVPTFVATGSEDFSSMGARGGKKGKSGYRLPEDAVFPDQPHYYLFMEGSDHYLGGLICRDDVPGPADAQAVAIINETTTAFLDAYIKDDRAAMALINAGDLPAIATGRATLTQR